MIPEILGLERFWGRVVHTGVYKSSSDFINQRVLVAGCGNFDMEVSLDLYRYNAKPCMVFRNTISSFPSSVTQKFCYGALWTFFNRFISI